MMSPARHCRAALLSFGTKKAASTTRAFAPHDLRRSFASNLLAQGEDLLTVKDAMGHAQVTTTQRYDHRGHERLKQARDKIKA